MVSGIASVIPFCATFEIRPELRYDTLSFILMLYVPSHSDSLSGDFVEYCSWSWSTML